MPRGTRKIPGAESVRDRFHHHLVAIMVEHEFLPTQCWCGHRIVAVPQRLVKEGHTFSCEDTGCTSPDGDYEPGLLCTDYGSILKEQDPAKWDNYLRPAGFMAKDRQVKHIRDLPRPAYRSAARVRPEARQEPQEVRTTEPRREAVERLWRQKKAPHDIAQELDLRMAVVIDDLQYLFKKGRIP